MKKIRNGVIIGILMMLIFLMTSQVQAKENVIEKQIKNYEKEIQINNISTEDILKVYNELSEQYSNEELADMIEEYKEEIQEQGISEEVISVGTGILRTTDTERVKEVIKNDIKIEEIQKKIEQGDSINQALQSTIKKTPNHKKIEIIAKLVLANRVLKTMVMALIVLFIYGTILRWRIYQKAQKHGWAAIIPVYRQIVMYQVCGLSPWLMLLWFVPIFGWFAMLIIAIMKRFCLSNVFGKGTLFGFGILLLPTIFQSIIAFNSRVEYEG